MKPIRNIIFDIGNVLMEYNWLLPFEQFGLEKEEARRISREMFDDIWKKLDWGLTDQEGAKAEYRIRYPADADAIDYFIDHMEIIRVDRPDVWERLPALKKKGFRLYYLSNYPEQLFAAHMDGVPFFNEMDGGVVSYEVHMGKPDTEIYEYLLKKYGLKPQECLFFDDKAENVEGAQKAGMAAVQIISREQLLEEIEKLV